MSLEAICEHIINHAWKLMHGEYDDGDTAPADHIGALGAGGAMLAWYEQAPARDVPWRHYPRAGTGGNRRKGSQGRDMTDADWLTLECYVRATADLFGLREWSIDVAREAPGDTEAQAECRVTIGRRHATIRFAPMFRACDLKTQRNTVAHELMHCHLAQIDHCVEWDLREAGAMSQQAHAIFFQTFSRLSEYTVDALAAVIAPMAPLIRWPRRLPQAHPVR